MYQVVKNILVLESKLMTRDKQFRNSKGWKANKSSYKSKYIVKENK